MITYIYEDFHIWSGSDDLEPHTLNVHVNLVCTDKGQPMSRNPPPGDPGHPPSWEIESIELRNDTAMQPVIMSETQFLTVFPDGSELVNNALEWASEQEIE